ncbi:MAG: hypothetical protein ACXWRE_12190 [Pseudobdellovibrionaceae bacterium]
MFCDRATSSELFYLTCGGWGLSGLIVSIGIQLGKLTSHQIQAETLPLEDIFQLPALLKARSLKDDLIYSWHDFNSQSHWGRGFLKVGRYLKSFQNETPDEIPDFERTKGPKKSSSSAR